MFGIVKRAGCLEGSLLVISPDDRFYCSVLYISTGRGWKTHWVRTVDQALEFSRSPIRLVLLDWYRHEMDWRLELMRLHRIESHPRVILASPFVDEDLWTAVLGNSGYDVVLRNEEPEKLTRAIEFGWARQSSGRQDGSGSKRVIGTGTPPAGGAMSFR